MATSLFDNGKVAASLFHDRLGDELTGAMRHVKARVVSGVTDGPGVLLSGGLRDGGPGPELIGINGAGTRYADRRLQGIRDADSIPMTKT